MIHNSDIHIGRRLALSAVFFACAGILRADPGAPSGTPSEHEASLIREIAELSVDPQPSLRTSMDTFVKLIVDRRTVQVRKIDELLKTFPKSSYRENALAQKIESMFALAALRGDSFAKPKRLVESVLAGNPGRELAGTATFWKVRCQVEERAAAGAGDDELFDMQTKLFGKFASAYPENPFAAEILGMLAQVALMDGRTEDARKHYELLKKHHANSEALIPLDADFWKRDALNKPFELKFTDTSGQMIDVAKMKGKVVLVDFWATWCGGCLQFMPELKRVYDQYHREGFEVVGVSLDYQRAQLDQFVKANGIAWPQYFDGKVWNSPLARQYRIVALPTMYLVDKKGLLRSVDPHTGLRTEVARLLAE